MVRAASWRGTGSCYGEKRHVGRHPVGEGNDLSEALWVEVVGSQRGVQDDTAFELVGGLRQDRQDHVDIAGRTVNRIPPGLRKSHFRRVVIEQAGLGKLLARFEVAGHPTARD
jgi:hypothetical protein